MIFYSVADFLSNNKQVEQGFLSIDLGSKKTGIAVSVNNSVAVPSSVIYEQSLERLCLEVLNLLKEKECKYVVLGFPFGWEEEPSAKRITMFAQMLSRAGVCVILYDENNTSIKVRGTAYDARGKMTKKEKQKYDAKVATLILSNMLDEMNALNKKC